MHVVTLLVRYKILQNNAEYADSAAGGVRNVVCFMLNVITICRLRYCQSPLSVGI